MRTAVVRISVGGHGWNRMCTHDTCFRDVGIVVCILGPSVLVLHFLARIVVVHPCDLFHNPLYKVGVMASAAVRRGRVACLFCHDGYELGNG